MTVNLHLCVRCVPARAGRGGPVSSSGVEMKTLPVRACVLSAVEICHVKSLCEVEFAPVCTVYAGPVSSVSKRNLPRACEVAAAQVGDAKGIRKKITEMKMHLIKDALKATGRG